MLDQPDTSVSRRLHGLKDEKPQIGQGFTALCDSVEQAVDASKDSLQQMYLLHDELTKRKLPSSIVSKLSTISCELQQNVSNLFIEVERLMEKTRLYAGPLETQCNLMMDLREQSEIKQRKLEIALKKLEIMNGRNEQLEKKRLIGLWEKLFVSCSSYRNVNFGWRNTVKEYQTKIKNNQSVAYLFRNLDDESSCGGDQQSTSHQVSSGGSPLYDEGDFHFSSDAGGEDEIEDAFLSAGSDVEDELQFETKAASSVLDWVSKVSTDVHKSCDITDEISSISPTLPMSKSRISVYDDEELLCQSQNVDTFESSKALPDIPANPPPLQCIVEEKPETSDSFTTTAQLDTFFQVRVVTPNWVKFDSPYYVLTFNNQVLKSQTSLNDPYEEEVSLLENSEKKLDNKASNSQHNVFCFNMECSPFDDVMKSIRLRNNTLRIALHEESSAGILAFASTGSNELQVYREEEVRDSNETDRFINNLELYFPGKSNSKNADDGLMMDLPVICTLFQREKMSRQDAYTETMTFDTLREKIVDEYVDYRLERCQSACVETDEKPIYTEECFNAVNDELTALKEGCDNTISCQVRVDAATSPLLGELRNELRSEQRSGIDYDVQLDYVQLYPRQAGSCPVRRVRFDDANMPFPEKRLQRGFTVPKMSSRSKRICEKLPDDFFARLRLFQEEKGKNRDQLRKNITEKNQEEMCKRLDAAQRLCSPGSTAELHESCLPSVFMPTRNNIVYKTKGRSYLHPSNQVAQLKPMFQLPNFQDNSPNRSLRTLRLDAVETVT